MVSLSKKHLNVVMSFIMGINTFESRLQLSLSEEQLGLLIQFSQPEIVLCPVPCFMFCVLSCVLFHFVSCFLFCFYFVFCFMYFFRFIYLLFHLFWPIQNKLCMPYNEVLKNYFDQIAYIIIPVQFLPSPVNPS